MKHAKYVLGSLLFVITLPVYADLTPGVPPVNSLYALTATTLNPQGNTLSYQFSMANRSLIALYFRAAIVEVTCARGQKRPLTLADHQTREHRLLPGQEFTSSGIQSISNICPTTGKDNKDNVISNAKVVGVSYYQKHLAPGENTSWDCGDRRIDVIALMANDGKKFAVRSSEGVTAAFNPKSFDIAVIANSLCGKPPTPSFNGQLTTIIKKFVEKMSWQCEQSVKMCREEYKKINGEYPPAAIKATAIGIR